MKRLELADGSFNNHPSAETVSMVIGNLGRPAEFAVLRDTREGYVQAAAGPRTGVAAGHFLLETKGSHSEQRHLRAEVADRSLVENAFTRFLADDRAWVDELDWDDEA